jgi:hypothetical protein
VGTEWNGKGAGRGDPKSEESVERAGEPEGMMSKYKQEDRRIISEIKSGESTEETP